MLMATGVPAHVDGRLLAITEQAGGRLVNPDRMEHYTEGLRNYDPIWPNHGIRILPGPSSMWFDATGSRSASRVSRNSVTATSVACSAPRYGCSASASAVRSTGCGLACAGRRRGRAGVSKV